MCLWRNKEWKNSRCDRSVFLTLFCSENRTGWWLKRDSIKKTQVHSSCKETECGGQVHRGRSRWCLQDLHNLSLTQTHTGDIIAVCQVCSWWPAVWHRVWAVCVYPVLPLCERGPDSAGSAASLALNHRTGQCVRSNTHMHALSCLFLSGLPQKKIRGQTSGLKSRWGVASL